MKKHSLNRMIAIPLVAVAFTCAADNLQAADCLGIFQPSVGDYSNALAAQQSYPSYSSYGNYAPYSGGSSGTTNAPAYSNQGMPSSSYSTPSYQSSQGYPSSSYQGAQGYPSSSYQGYGPSSAQSMMNPYYSSSPVQGTYQGYQGAAKPQSSYQGQAPQGMGPQAYSGYQSYSTLTNQSYGAYAQPGQQPGCPGGQCGSRFNVGCPSTYRTGYSANYFDAPNPMIGSGAYMDNTYMQGYTPRSYSSNYIYSQPRFANSQNFYGYSQPHYSGFNPSYAGGQPSQYSNMMYQGQAAPQSNYGYSQYSTPMYTGYQGGSNAPSYKGSNAPSYQYQGNAPSYQGANAPSYQYQGNAPSYQGANAPSYQYQGNAPSYQGSNAPSYQGSNPSYQGSNPSYQGSNPSYQGSSRPTSYNDQNYQGGYPSNYGYSDNSRNRYDSGFFKGNSYDKNDSQDQATMMNQQMMMQQQQLNMPVLDIIANNPQFSNFFRLLQASGELSRLQGPGPFTIFVPTNASFDKLSQSKIQDWTKPENKETLKEIIDYHIVSGRYLANELKDAKIKSLVGDTLSIDIENNGEMKVEDARIVVPNLVGTNGVIHGIDRVLNP